MANKEPRGRAGGEARRAQLQAESMGEYVLGYVPRRDGSDWNDDALTPTWNSLLDLLEEEDILSCDIVIYGKIYMSSDAIGSDARHIVNTDELFTHPRYVTPDEPDVPGSGIFARRNTPAYMEALFKYDEGTIQKVAGIVIRKLS